jgi:hypothetical protein
MIIEPDWDEDDDEDEDEDEEVEVEVELGEVLEAVFDKDDELPEFVLLFVLLFVFVLFTEFADPASLPNITV